MDFNKNKNPLPKNGANEVNVDIMCSVCRAVDVGI